MGSREGIGGRLPILPSFPLFRLLPPPPSSSPFVRWDMKGRRIYSALTGGGERERKVGSVGGNICGRRLSNIFFTHERRGREGDGVGG